ncbi:T6SS immunity protein Tli4 family protein [Pseudomonas sp. URMO17WK12:I11]|uniref:T6SS immunity protein Tli4 family protein n=1 Tax=Pseudomonas sp. URMO17WK12:I11 TaxID=1283291 RepID=UPI002114ED6B|nr:T6SS immunity protein Tli4 family protein [Pseudomonas sp. URMO17WK12:I11]
MRSMYKASLTLFALWLLNISVAAANKIEGNAMDDTNWTTHYFGRFEITLPKGSKISADYKIFNENLVLVSKNGRANLPTLVNQKTEELKKGIARGTSSRYEKTVPLDNGSMLLLSRLGEFYTFNAYLLSNKNTLYHLMAKTITEKSIPGGIEKMRLLSNTIFFRHPNEAPPPGGFAIEAGYTTLPNDEFFESIYMGAQISGHPGTYISLLTKGILEKEPTLLQRFDNHEYDSSLNELANSGRMRTLRKQKRSIGDLNGEEVAISTSIYGKQYYAFQFEYEGTLESNTRPYVAIELGTHEEGSNFSSDDEALAFWDRMLANFKPLSE